MIVSFEITGDHIAELNDTDLRSLIGLLCEADYRAAGLRTAGITWGGYQDSKDGGLDVVVRDEIPPPFTSFVPRKITGFQVKKSAMGKAKILKEMKPEGALREKIKSLIRDKGAYVIVSPGSSVSDMALDDRRNAMRDAVADEDNAHDIHLDFFDRGRVATWVRSYPSMILWVREKIGRPVRGWRPYGNWAYSPSGVGEEYLLDPELRLRDETVSAHERLNAEDGLLKFRSILSVPGMSVRLAGLSGVGKTRFAQALFDPRIGERALNRFHAFYTDTSRDPSPTPEELAELLVNEGTEAVLVVDNCPPSLHRRLTQICSENQSSVSLLTVEYDVREDVPEETTVFRLEPASAELILSLIEKRFPHISPVDARTIADFSGGNARVALLLAGTVQKGEMLSGLRDEELFNRLFWQRHAPDEKLLASAQACSLVYSFEGVDTSSGDSELKFLASLIDNKPVNELFCDVAKLESRGLVQSRGRWRAVLPHAVANRLARRAIESTPREFLVNKFLCSGSERLIRSFTHRLSYLHDCDIAVEIVNNWLGENGWIGKFTRNLNALGIYVLKNIAPVSPSATLDAIERATGAPGGGTFTSAENAHSNEFVQLLRHLAYDAQLFDRSVKILCRFALSESDGEHAGSALDVLKSLFHVRLSGTHASPEARACVISRLVNSQDRNERELGILLLEAALKTSHFSTYFRFDFGARSRDFGYSPQTLEEIVRWFSPFIEICETLAVSDRPIAEHARKLLADSFYGLWEKMRMFDVLERSVAQIHTRKPWNDGWIAVCDTIRYSSGNAGNGESINRLHKLKELLKPDNLLEKARTIVLSDQRNIVDLEEGFNPEESASARLRRTRESILNTGAQVARDPDVLNILLPDLVTAQGMRLLHFGNGLAEGCADKREVFQVLRSALANVPLEKRQIDVILGFLQSCEKSDPAFCNLVLDEMVEDHVLGEYFPFLQINMAAMDQLSIKRLHKALDLGRAKIHMFHFIALKHGHNSVSDDELALLLRKILPKEEGIGIVIENLAMRFDGPDNKRSDYSSSLLDVGREALQMYFSHSIRKARSNDDYSLARIARVCLNGQEGTEYARRVCQNISDGMKNCEISSFTYLELLGVLARNQTEVFLDTFLLGEHEAGNYLHTRMFSDDNQSRDNPFNRIDDGELVSWCDHDPGVRYPLLASAMGPFRRSDATGKYEWKPAVFAILEKAPDLNAVLENLQATMIPSVWSGSLADIMQEVSDLFLKLREHHNPEIRLWAENRDSHLQESIRRERGFEEQRRSMWNEGFE